MITLESSTTMQGQNIGMNLKQLELAEELLRTINAVYPQTEFVGYRRDPDDKTIIWIQVETPIADEDEEMLFRRFHNDLTNEITNTYGYDFFVMSHNPLRQLPPYQARQAA